MTEPTSKTPAMGRELDILIAEKVMGWTPIIGAEAINAFEGLDPNVTMDRGLHRKQIWVCGEGRMACLECGSMPEFSTELSDAFRVVDKLKLSMIHREGHWYVGRFAEGTYIAFTPEDTDEVFAASLTVDGRLEPCGVSEELPRAICLAALAALEAR